MRGSAFGYEVESELALERLRPEVGSRGRLRVTRAREALLDRDGELTALDEPAPGAPVASFALARTDEGLLAWCSVTGSFLIREGGGEIAAEPLRGTTPNWEHRLLAMVVPLALGARGDLVLHASAVVVDGAAVLFCGPTGRGKSTLALALGARGYPVLAEDGVAITFEADRPLAWPGPLGVRLKGDAGARLGWERGETITRSEQRGPEVVRAAAEADREVPVGAVVLLGERGASLEVGSLEPARALTGLVPALFHPGRAEGLRPAYALAARLATTAAGHRARLPDDLETAPAAAEALVERVMGGVPA